MFASLFCGVFLFLSTLSLRRATRRHRSNDRCPVDFYPRSPCGERPTDMRKRLIEFRFLSTLSLRRATSSIDDLEPSTTHFYPRSPCGERPQSAPRFTPTANFYPRSPCGERLSTPNPGKVKVVISIHALLAESDNRRSIFFGRAKKFLSTLSLRRATISCARSASKLADFYPRSPCGERLSLAFGVFLTCIFLSTLSLRRATPARQKPT